MKFKNVLLKILPYFYAVMFILCITLIFIKAAEPADVSSSASSNLSNYLQNNSVVFNQISKNVDDFHALVRKFIGHYGLFALTGFFGFLTFASISKTSVHSLCLAAISATLVSIISELIQDNTDGRFFSVSDIILNVQGFVSGNAVALVLFWIYERKRRENFYASVTAYLTFALFAILTLFLYQAISQKIESIEFCTIVEIAVVSLWLITEGVFLIIKYNLTKKQTTAVV